MTDLLVIGYGNDLRSDDGAGRRVADAIETMALPGVAVRSVPQLTPELALEIAGRDRVVFVDADVEAQRVTVAPVSPGTAATGVMTHHGDPTQLLALAAAVGPVPQEVIAVSIPAAHLGLGFELSPGTAAAVAEAVDMIAAVVREVSPDGSR